MEIIKVVHSDSDTDLDASRQSTAIESYRFDVEAFLKKPEGQKRELSDWLNRRLIRGVDAKLVSMALKAAGRPEKEVDLFDFQKQEMRKIAKRVSDAVILDVRQRVHGTRVMSLESALEQFPRTNNLSVGTFTFHPYDRRALTRLESFHTNLAMEKDDELITLLGRMGAKTVRIIEITAGSSLVEGQLDIRKLSATVQGQVSMQRDATSGNDLMVSFEGNPITVDENLLKTSRWFSTDSKLTSILDSRRFDPNKIEQYTLRSTYRETFDFDFELAARFMVVETDIKTQYRTLSQKERLFHVEFGRSSG